MRHSPLDTVLLAGIGTLSVHEIAYMARSFSASSSGVEVAHGHLPLMWGVGGAVAILAMGRMVIASVRSRGSGLTVDPKLLTAAIATLYVSQEAAELSLAGEAAWSLLSQPVLWLGLVAAPLVAWALARLVSTIQDAVTAEPLLVAPAGLVLVARPRQVLLAASLHNLAHCLCRRGPPSIRFS